MKVCHIVHQSWPAVCGSVSRLENILDAQKKKDINVFVISSPFQAPSAKGARLEVNRGTRYYRSRSQSSLSGVKVERTLFDRLRRALSLVSFTWAVFKICKRERPDIIHAHATFAMGIPALIVAFLLRMKFVYEMRSTWEEDIRGNFFIDLQKRIVKNLECFVARRSDYVFFVSQGIMLHYFKDPLPNGLVVYNSVRVPDFSCLPSRSSEKYSFGYVGSLVSYEGLELLVKASSVLEERYSNFEVNIFGDGPEKLPLEELASSLCVRSVKFHGRVSYDSIDDAYSIIDCIVLPRKRLAITEKVAGLKPVEAFAYHKLVIASDVGGMREIFTDSTHGLFFDADNVLDLARLMEEVLLGQVNEDLIKQSAFRLFQEKFTIESMGASYLNVYLEVLNE